MSGSGKPENSGQNPAVAGAAGLSLEHALTEELQATTEELQAANDELLRRNEALVRLNSDIRNLLESAAIPMLFLDSDLRIRNFTPDIAALFNLIEADKGRSIADITHRLLSFDPIGIATAVMQTGEIMAHEVGMQGAGTVFLMRARPYRTAEGATDGVVLTFVDVSEAKLARDQINHAGKLIALGEMATGMAHELNQPLNAIKLGIANITARLRRGDMPADDILPRLVRIEHNVTRANKVISHMRDFGRRVEEAPACFDAAEAVRDACTLAQQELASAEVTVEIIEAGARPPVRGHQSLLEQVMLNLLLNARDAILSRREVEPGLPGHVQVTLEGSTAGLVLRLRDNGQGVPPEVAGRIFEAFFTTKEIGKGTGLGLSISARIIEEMGGRISLEAVAEGSCFRIDLPAAEVPA